MWGVNRGVNQAPTGHPSSSILTYTEQRYLTPIHVCNEKSNFDNKEGMWLRDTSMCSSCFNKVHGGFNDPQKKKEGVIISYKVT